MTPHEPVAPGASPLAGPGTPEKTKLTIGFIALTDCASLVMAHELGLFRKHGLDVTLSRQPSWAAIRDRLSLGELDAAHLLYGMVYGVHLGIGGPRQDMAILMGLNHNGQGIVLSRQLRELGAVDGPSLKKVIARGGRRYTFAQTFPTGTHAMWLYYWLAAAGIHPLRDVNVITVPPPQMVANMRAGNMDGYCVGEPWGGARAIQEGIGFTATTTQAIWRNHPEKVLGTTRAFVERHPNTARAMIRAVLEASRYIDIMANRDRVAGIISAAGYVDAPAGLIAARLRGEYENGLGRKWQDPDCMKFFNDGEVNYPYLSHGMWFLTQQRRWGLLQQDVDYLAVAREVNRIDLYAEVARTMGIAVPQSPLKTERLFDGVVWDPSAPQAYVESFAIRA
ncbi:MAG: CmpA/NrtA family ABC transporter substrate-binding protein [Nevskia sp.]|nr:CmpA/NrtA family ABC transporter substrate-binding protein [Nevskia sp.]